MKTSLSILCAYFAIAASTSTFTWVNLSESDFALVKCKDKVNLHFVAIDDPRGIWIEKNSLCTIVAGDIDQLGGVNAGRTNDRSPVEIYDKNCNWFFVMVPKSHIDISQTVIECVHHD